MFMAFTFSYYARRPCDPLGVVVNRSVLDTGYLLTGFNGCAAL